MSEKNSKVVMGPGWVEITENASCELVCTPEEIIENWDSIFPKGTKLEFVSRKIRRSKGKNRSVSRYKIKKI